MSKLYHLVYEDLTHLGGPMGTEYTTESDWGYFTSVQKAKKKAEDYHNPKADEYEKIQKEHSNNFYLPIKRIKWKRDFNGNWRSQDLGYVMFHIRPVKVEA